MAGNEIATIEKELENIYNEMKGLATDGSALERFQCFDEAYQRTRLRERTTLVFCGKYSTGKSTIMRALTGDDSIPVGVGETTNHNKEFLWGDGLLLVDTPGIFTDTAANGQEARRAMDEADMIAYCISADLLFDHAKNETGYFKQMLRDYRDKLFLCITKCPRTDQNLYFNIQNDIFDAIGEDAYYGTGVADILSILIFDAKDYINGQKDGDKGLIHTSNFECFLDCINGFSESDVYASRCTTRLRQMQSCLGEILETIPCLSQEDRKLSKEEIAELNRIEAVRQQAYACTKDLYSCEIKIMRDMRETLRQDNAAELLPQIEKAAYIELKQAVDDVLKRIRSVLEELEIYVHVDNPEMAELKIDSSDIRKGSMKGWLGQYIAKITEQVGDIAPEGVKTVAGMAKEDVTKRKIWQFWKKAPEIGGKGTKLYQHLSGSGIGQKVAPQIGKCAVFLENHQVAMQGSFAAVGIGIDLIQEIRGEWNERKRQAAIDGTLQDFNVNIRQIVHSIIEDIKKIIDSNCQEARDTIQTRLAVRLGYDTPEDRARQTALDLQNRIDHLRAEFQSGGSI